MTEEEILTAVQFAFSRGLVVEPSGAAALAAFLAGKVERAEGEQAVVIILTGGNVSPSEMAEFSSRVEA